MTIIEDKRNRIMNKIQNTNDESLLDFMNILTETKINDQTQNDLEFADFKSRLDNSIDDYHNDRLTDSQELKKEILEWV